MRLTLRIALLCVLVHPLFAWRATAAIPSAERDALIAIYNATGGTSWTDKTGWGGVAGTECDWLGVDCDDASTTVTSLYLEDNNLAGTIPGSAVAALKNLETLGLARGALTGPIPTEIGSLTKLQNLYLWENQLTGSIPAQLGNLTALRELSLSANQLSGTISSSLGNLGNLEALWLDHNQLTGSFPEAATRLPLLQTLLLNDNTLSGSLPASIGNMGALRELNLSTNSFDGSIPAGIGNLKNLETLNLCTNNFTGTIPEQISSLTNLKYIYLCNNQLTGSIPTGLGSLTNLLELNFASNSLSGAIPVDITQLANLTSLELSGTSLTGTIPSQFSNMKNLTYLGLSETLITGSIPAEIGEMSSLRELLLYSNKLSGSIPAQLGQLSNLETLVLESNGFSGSLPPELGNLASLQRLSVAQNNLSGQIPSQFANLKNLVTFSIYSNSFSGTIPTFLGSLTKLEDLSLGYNKLTGTIPIELTQLTNLTALDLGNNLITGTIPAQIGNLTKLGYLGLGDDDLEGSIPSSIGQLTSLQWLYLYSNRLSGQIPAQIGNLKLLEDLSLSDNALTGSIPREIGNMKNLKYLELSMNQLSGTIPLELANLTLLENLALEENNLQGTIPRELGSLRNLGLLDLSYNRLTGSIPTEISNLTHLEYLLLGYNSLSGSIPSTIGALSSLLILTLDRNLLSGAFPSELGNLRNLRTLALAVNSLQGAIPESLANLTSLGDGELDINYNGLFTTSSSLRAFLNSKCYGGEWESTQTVTPTNVAVGAISGTSVVLTWNRIKYYWDDGGYEIFLSTNPAATTPDRVVTTACKELTSEIIPDLAPQMTYYFKIRAVTYAHDDQQGTIRSDFSPVVSGKSGTATLQPANIVVTTLPYGMVQDANAAEGYDYFVLTNVGDAETTVTLTQQGSFYTIDTPSTAIGPGESAYVNVNGIAQPAGAYEGSVAFSGTGVPSGLSVPIYLLSVVPPTGSVIAEAAVTRVDLIAPESESPHGTVQFTNTGSATLNGIVVADVPWIVPPAGLVTIAPAGTTTVSFSIDRTKRPDAAELAGAVSGNLSLLFADGRSAKSRSMNGDPPPGTSVSTVTVVDTVQSGATATPIPPLGTDEVALVMPGVAQLTSGGTILTDVTLANAFGSSAIKDLKLYYAQAGASAQSFMSGIPNLSTGQGLKLANVVQSMFGKQSQVGTLQMRTKDITAVNVFAKVLNATSKSGTFGTAVPVFRSDRAARPAQKITLTGLRSDTGYRTSLYIQETSGNATTVQIEFLDANGARVGSARPADSIGAFSVIQLQNIVPSGAVSATITVGTTGRVAAYAAITDEASGDLWTVLDWARYYDFIPNEAQIVPAVGALGSAGTAGRQRAIKRPGGSAAKSAAGVMSDLAIMNSGSTAASATLRFYDRTATVAKTVTLQPGAAKIITDVASYFGRPAGANGYVRVEPSSGSFAVSSRIYAGSYSAGVPVLSARTGVRYGQTKAMAGLDDSRKINATLEAPGTFSTGLVLLETGGKSVKLRATISYSDGGSVVAAIGQGTRDFSLAANQFTFYPNLAAAILGSSRETSLGDLENVKVSFQVIEGDGSAAILTTSTDNASGDAIVRYE